MMSYESSVRPIRWHVYLWTGFITVSTYNGAVRVFADLAANMSVCVCMDMFMLEMKRMVCVVWILWFTSQSVYYILFYFYAFLFDQIIECIWSLHIYVCGLLSVFHHQGNFWHRKSGCVLCSGVCISLNIVQTSSSIQSVWRRTLLW